MALVSVGVNEISDDLASDWERLVEEVKNGASIDCNFEAVIDILRARRQ